MKTYIVWKMKDTSYIWKWKKDDVYVCIQCNCSKNYTIFGEARFAEEDEAYVVLKTDNYEEAVEYYLLEAI